MLDVGYCFITDTVDHSWFGEPGHFAKSLKFGHRVVDFILYIEGEQVLRLLVAGQCGDASGELQRVALDIPWRYSWVVIMDAPCFAAGSQQSTGSLDFKRIEPCIIL